MEDISKVTFSQEASKILQECLYPQRTSIDFTQQLQLITQYRTNPEKTWEELDWKGRVNLFSSLDEEEKMPLLASISVEDLKHFLLVLPQGDRFNIRLINEKYGYFSTK